MRTLKVGEIIETVLCVAVGTAGIMQGYVCSYRYSEYYVGLLCAAVVTAGIMQVCCVQLQVLRVLCKPLMCAAVGTTGLMQA